MVKLCLLPPWRGVWGVVLDDFKPHFYFLCFLFERLREFSLNEEEKVMNWHYPIRRSGRFHIKEILRNFVPFGLLF